MVKRRTRTLRRSHKAYAALLGAVGLERIWELWLSRRHAAWAKEHGGLEFGRRQLVLMKALQAGLLAGSLTEAVVFKRPARWQLAAPMLVCLLGAQALRYWAVGTLGRRWNVRVIVIPGFEAETGGPYRFMRHPNYVAVMLEGVALPLVHTSYVTAVVFSALNALVLRARIRCEERALSTHSRYDALFADKRRFLPRRPTAPPAPGAAYEP